MDGALGSSRDAVAGRYLLVDRIGAGAMGTVWRAYDLRTQRWVAAKVLAEHNGTMLLRFVREQGVRIHHEHVVAPTGWAADDDTVVFTMDLVRGGSVTQLLAEHGPLPVEYVAVLLDQLLAALAAVHAAGVVHRDVKPANLLLEVTGSAAPHLRLGDFGVAVAQGSPRLTQAPGMVGTEGYAPPEQEAGLPPHPTQDLYAAGRVGIQLLTGLGPQRQTGAPPGPLAPLLTALVAPDSRARPASAAAARRQLAGLGVAPWRQRPGGPVVTDRLGEASVPLPRALLLPERVAGRRTPPGVLVAAGCFTGAIGLSAAALVRVLG